MSRPGIALRAEHKLLSSGFSDGAPLYRVKGSPSVRRASLTNNRTTINTAKRAPPDRSPCASGRDVPKAPCDPGTRRSSFCFEARTNHLSAPRPSLRTGVRREQRRAHRCGLQRPRAARSLRPAQRARKAAQSRQMAHAAPVAARRGHCAGLRAPRAPSGPALRCAEMSRGRGALRQKGESAPPLSFWPWERLSRCEPRSN